MDTRQSLRSEAALVFGACNSIVLQTVHTDPGRQAVRMYIRDIQSSLDQMQQALDDLRDYVSDLEEAPF